MVGPKAVLGAHQVASHVRVMVRPSNIPMEIVSPKELLGPHECCPYATRRPPHPYSTFGITWPDEAPSDMGQLPAPFFPGRKRHTPAFGSAISSARRHTPQRSCPYGASLPQVRDRVVKANEVMLLFAGCLAIVLNKHVRTPVCTQGTRRHWSCPPPLANTLKCDGSPRRALMTSFRTFPLF